MAYRRKGSEWHRELAEWLIDEKGANAFEWALSGACMGGHRELAEWLIDEKGANDFNWALHYAWKGGHRELAELLKVKKAKKN